MNATVLWMIEVTATMLYFINFHVTEVVVRITNYQKRSFRIVHVT